MAYKTILTVCTDPDRQNEILTQAVTLARAHEAHLDVLCIGMDRSQTGYHQAGLDAVLVQQALSRASDEAEAMAETARKALLNMDALWSVESSIAQIADIGRKVAARARFCDLAILPKPYGEDAGFELETVVEGTLFEGQIPVLILPQAASPAPMPQRVVLGWNESSEALRAVRAALPVLRQASMVHVAVIDPPRHGAGRSDPGGALSTFLARHGIRAEIDVLSKTLPRVSDMLQRHVEDLGADLVVMGAYGHSRFRESILGGATRNILEQARVPVLMAH